MIEIDHKSSVPISTQLSDRLRYLIASGAFQAGDRLPSTRAMAGQLDVSYHTVRAAYRQLESEGLLSGRTGRGYHVIEHAPPSRALRMEEGAAVVQEALQKLVGLGLELDEIDYLVQEQVALISGDSDERKVVFAARSEELAEQCASQIAAAVRHAVDGVSFDSLEQHGDADFIITSFDDVRRAMQVAPRADVRGVVVHLNADALERIVRLMEGDTLGVVAGKDDTVPLLMQSIRAETGFGGQMIASAAGDRQEVAALVDQASLVVYTPASRRRVLPLVQDHAGHVSISPVVTSASLAALRHVIPTAKY